MSRSARAALVLLALLLGVPSAGAGTARELQRRYGTGAIRSGTRAWSAAELQILEASLGALRRDERRGLRGVDLVRVRSSPRPFGAGLYVVDRRGPRILIYDRAFRGPGRGSSRRPNRTIVHEVGHALADLPAREALDRARRAVRAGNDAVAGYNAEVRRHNGAARRFNRSQRREDRRAWERSNQRLVRLGAALRDQRSAALRARRRARIIARRSRPPLPRLGILASYRPLLRGRRGPTPYGRRNLKESFAESFSLFHCDRAALRRALPEVDAWLARGGHLDALKISGGRGGSRPPRGLPGRGWAARRVSGSAR